MKRVVVSVLGVAMMASPAAAQQPASAEEAAREAELPDSVKQMLESDRERERCLAENKDASPEVRAKRESTIRSRPIVQVHGVGGFHAGATSTGFEADFGWTLGADAIVGLLQPLYLAGGARLFQGGEQTQLHVDAVAGFNFRTYGNRWVKAGYSTSDAVVYSWGSHCQLRRDDFALVGGVKIIAPGDLDGSSTDAPTITALQVGMSSSFRNDSATINWSLAGLWDPAQEAYGGQFTFGASSFLLFFPLRSLPWLYTNYSGGVIIGSDVKAWWTTADLGITFEI